MTDAPAMLRALPDALPAARAPQSRAAMLPPCPTLSTDGRTDGLTEKWSPLMNPSPNASRAGGQDESHLIGSEIRARRSGACLCGCGERPRSGRNYARGHTAPATVEGRILARVAISPSGCWEYQGCRNRQGYGHVNAGKGTYGDAHRLLYEIRVGPVPPGLHLDHLCRNRACCNPDHLEPVTPRENIHRGIAPTVVASLRGECLRGHDQAAEASRRRDGRVVYCRACRREDRAAQARPLVGTCPTCGGEMRGRRDAKFCSVKCNRRARTIRERVQ